MCHLVCHINLKGNNMLLIVNALAVFAITLIITKSKIMASKREFVEARYELAKIGVNSPDLIHRWWHALITCPMCAGFWIAIIICWIYPVVGIFVDVLVVFGANWLLHCLENLLFFLGKLAEKADTIDIESHLKEKQKFYDKWSSDRWSRLMEKNLKKSLDSD